MWICGNENKTKSITKHIACIDDMNKEKVIATMKLVYWMVQEDVPLSKYESLCLFTMSLHTPNIPKNKDYASYTNHTVAKEFLFIISQYLEELQISKMLDSPFFSLMLDESTDHRLEKHLVVYVTFLNSKGLGPPISQFLKLINVCDGRRKTTYDAIKHLMEARGLSKERLIGVSTDCASSMFGNENGFITFLRKDVPNLVGVHCVAHREALATLDASKRIPKLLFVAKLANKYFFGCKIL